STQFKEVLWTKDPTGSRLEAVEIPGGTIGQRLGAPVQSPGSCPGGNVSTDGDGLLDCWKNGSLWPADRKPGISYAGVYDGNVANRDIIPWVPSNTTNIAPDRPQP